MEKGSLLEQRQTRILETVALEKPDRTPVILEYAGFAARVTNTPLPEFLSSVIYSVKTMIEAFHIIGEADAINYGSYFVYDLCYLWMSKVKVPGIDLAQDSMYQVAEAELMKVEDYDQILRKGWPDFYRGFMEDRVLNNVPLERLPSGQTPIDIRAEWAAHGIPVFNGGVVSTPFELLCGARSLNKFSRDLHTIPEKVQKVMDFIVPQLPGPVCKQAKSLGYPAVWVGGWRSASNMLSPHMWERFVWLYFERVVKEVVSSGLIAILHLDSDWTRDLSHFRSLPKSKCILATDGQTDLLKAKEVLNGHMCLMGDVPAAMLTLATPDEIYEYSRKLIRELGPEGFILHSGCDIPVNAKLSNVQVMVSAATGK
jgi:hypothetical protein